MDELLKEYGFEQAWQYYDLMSETFTKADKLSVKNKKHKMYKDLAVKQFNRLSFNEQKDFLSWAASGQGDEDAEHSGETFDFFLDLLGDPDKSKTFCERLKKLGDEARDAITLFLGNRETFFMWVGNGDADNDPSHLPPFIFYTKQGDAIECYTIAIEAGNNNYTCISGINRHNYSEILKLNLWEIEPGEACDIIDYLNSL